MELPLILGMYSDKGVLCEDLATMPHLLIAGDTGQGTSMALHAVIESLQHCKSDYELKLALIDPKGDEFERYGCGAASPEEAAAVLKSLNAEMVSRYKTLIAAKLRSRKTFAENDDSMPYIVAVINEFSALTMAGGTVGNSIAQSILQIAKKDRLVGIHLVMATERPDRSVISGLIKAHFPTRLALKVSSRTDSGTILDMPGAEKLIGEGDALFQSGLDTTRIQIGYLKDDVFTDAKNIFEPYLYKIQHV